MSVLKKIVTVAFLLGFFSSSTEAFLSQGYNIEQLSSKADTIFMGEVTQVESSPVSGNAQDLPYIQVYFKVFESFKGAVPATYSFNQFAPKMGTQFKLLGMSRDSYVPGLTVILFLGTASPRTGFEAPADFHLFALQTKSSRQSDIDKSLILNKYHGEKVGGGLFENLQKTNTLRIVNNMNKKNKLTSGVTFKDFRDLIQASVQP